jgi:membrane associated rhomboid family serine protease
MTTSDDRAADARNALEAARAAAERGEHDVASEMFGRLVGNQDPMVHVAALLGLADARYRLDDDEGALKAWIVATQAPETPLAWRAWVALAGARVRAGDLVGAARAYREAEPRAPFEERPAIASRLGWLNKEMGNTRTAQRHFGRARPGAFTPLVTYGIIAVTVIVTLLQTTPIADGRSLIDLLALDKEAVRQDGEYWRLLTVALVHDPRLFLHLLMNMFALYIVGPLAEALYGRATFVAIYLLSTLGGSIASYLFLPGVSVGASGAVFGLFGLVFASTYLHKPLLGAQARALASQIGVLIVINLVIGFGIGGFRIDNAAHVGGLLVGGWLGAVIPPRGARTLSSMWQRGPGASEQKQSRVPAVLTIGGVIALGAVMVVALQVAPTWA